jgi:DNA-binding MurR/RpiR family transcriptional regulator
VLALASKKKTEKNSPSITKKTKVSERTNDVTKLEKLKVAAEVLYKAADAAFFGCVNALLLTLILAYYLLVPLALVVIILGIL